MAREAVLVVQTHLPIPMTVADGTAITKGALLKLSDPFTAATGTATNDVCAGIAAADKIASDGVTQLAVYRGGIFKGTASGSITVGDPVGLVVTGTGNNYLGTQRLTPNLSGSLVFGIALETCTTGETFLFELRPMAIPSMVG